MGAAVDGTLMAEPEVFTADGRPGVLVYDREGNPRIEARAQEIAEVPWYDRPAWQSRVPMAFGATGPTASEAIDYLPQIGGAVGGVVGGGGIGALTAGTASVPGALGGAAVGGAAGEAARAGLRAAFGMPGPSTPFEVASGVVKEAAGQALFEGLGQGVAQFTRGAAAPGRAAMDPAVEAATARLRGAPGGAGLELPASARTQSWPVSRAEAWAAEGFGGAGTQARIQGAGAQLTAIADHTVARASTLQDPLQQGGAIFRGMQAFKDAWIQLKNGIYRDVDREMPWGWTTLPRTTELIADAVKGQRAARRVLGGTEANERFFEETLDKLTKVVEQNGQKVRVLKNVRIGDLEAATHKIDAMVNSWNDPFAAGNAGFLKKLAATMDEELLGAIRAKNPTAATRLLAAREAYEAGISRINSTWGEYIWKLGREGRYDLIAPAIMNRRMSVADVPKIFQVVGPEGADAIRTSVLASLVNTAKGTAKEGGEAVLTPLGLEKAAKGFGWERLQAILTPEQYQRVKDLALASGAMGRVKNSIWGSPTAAKLRWGAYITSALEIAKGVAGVAGAHPFTAMGYLAGDAAMSRFISTEAGQRWLTTGWPKAGRWAATATGQLPRAGWQTMVSGEGE